MKVLVPVKRVVDANVKVRVKPDNTGVDLTNVKMAVNPFCEIAIEEAVRLKEAGSASEVVAIAVGGSVCQEQLRTCLALGADRAVLIETEEDVQPLGIAKALKALQDKEQADIVIFGKQSIDGDNSQTRHTEISVPFASASCMRRQAADSPDGPPPTITTSNSMDSRSIKRSPSAIESSARLDYIGCHHLVLRSGRPAR